MTKLKYIYRSKYNSFENDTILLWAKIYCLSYWECSESWEFQLLITRVEENCQVPWYCCLNSLIRLYTEKDINKDACVWNTLKRTSKTMDNTTSVCSVWRQAYVSYIFYLWNIRTYFNVFFYMYATCEKIRTCTLRFVLNNLHI